MKKVISMLLVVLICLSMASVASAEGIAYSVEETAVYLLNDALTMPNDFPLPDLSGKTLYLCNAISPYTLKGDKLQPCNDIEYYFVRTENELIACITLCYENGNLLSACFDISTAETLSANCKIDEAFQLIAQNGKLYVKTADDINAEITRMPSETKFLNSISAKIVGTADNTEVLTVKSTLTGVITDPVIPRSSKILNVPYVAQGVNTCWAAAGVAVGKYYTGISSYTADELAAQMGYPNQSAGMSVTKSLLTRFYQVNTTYYSGRLSDSVAINLFQQSKPIIAGFTGYAYINGNIGSVAHMVVLCGYDDHATGVNITFYVRDSEHTSLKSVISYSADKLALDYNEGVLLYWVEGLY